MGAELESRVRAARSGAIVKLGICALGGLPGGTRDETWSIEPAGDRNRLSGRSAMLEFARFPFVRCIRGTLDNATGELPDASRAALSRRSDSRKNDSESAAS